MDRLLPPSASLEIWENDDFIFILLLFQDFPQPCNLCSIEWQWHNYGIIVLMLHAFIKADFFVVCTFLCSIRA